MGRTEQREKKELQSVLRVLSSPVGYGSSKTAFRLSDEETRLFKVKIPDVQQQRNAVELLPPTYSASALPSPPTTSSTTDFDSDTKASRQDKTQEATDKIHALIQKAQEDHDHGLQEETTSSCSSRSPSPPPKKPYSIRPAPYYTHPLECSRSALTVLGSFFRNKHVRNYNMTNSWDELTRQLQSKILALLGRSSKQQVGSCLCIQEGGKANNEPCGSGQVHQGGDQLQHHQPSCAPADGRSSWQDLSNVLDALSREEHPFQDEKTWIVKFCHHNDLSRESKSSVIYHAYLQQQAGMFLAKEFNRFVQEAEQGTEKERMNMNLSTMLSKRMGTSPAGDGTPTAAAAAAAGVVNKIAYLPTFVVRHETSGELGLLEPELPVFSQPLFVRSGTACVDKPILVKNSRRPGLATGLQAAVQHTQMMTTKGADYGTERVGKIEMELFTAFRDWCMATHGLQPYDPQGFFWHEGTLYLTDASFSTTSWKAKSAV
ncbi:unnamed protein product [Amoebophrya sp. A25]|nr:unnamed protein product [Amoebophrya sp. A25]|eukprot:GSA25T00019762001.1